MIPFRCKVHDALLHMRDSCIPFSSNEILYIIISFFLFFLSLFDCLTGPLDFTGALDADDGNATPTSELVPFRLLFLARAAFGATSAASRRCFRLFFCCANLVSFTCFADLQISL